MCASTHQAIANHMYSLSLSRSKTTSIACSSFTTRPYSIPLVVGFWSGPGTDYKCLRFTRRLLLVRMYVSFAALISALVLIPELEPSQAQSKIL